MTRTAALKAGQTVTVKAPYAAYRVATGLTDQTALITSTDSDGTLELTFSDGEIAYFDKWEVEA
jgi:hypothetical protein